MSADQRRPRLHVVVPSRPEWPERVDLPATVTDRRPASADTLLSLAKAADLGGLDGLVLPAGPQDLEPWVIGAHLLRRTRHLTIYIPVEPGTATPQYAAKYAASLQRFSAGRVGWALAADDEAATFVAAARSFWADADGLPDVLSSHAFPHVLTQGDPAVARLDTTGVDAAALSRRVGELAGAGVEDVLIDTGAEAPEVLRIAERVLPSLRATPLTPIGDSHVG